MKHDKKKENFVAKISLERIYRLFELAESEFAKHPERAKRYVELARKISRRNKAIIPQELKKKFCKKCGAFLNSKNSKIRITKGYFCVTCKECGNLRKIGISKSFK